MNQNILIMNAYDNQTQEKILKNIKVESFHLSFPEDEYEQLKILKKIYKSNLHIYIMLYAFYQTSIGTIRIPYWYDGRLIVSRELGSTVLEFKYDERLLEKDSRKFIQSLFWTSGIYISTMNPQEMQNYYYEQNEALLKGYLNKLICFIEIDNDGSYMKFYYDETKRIDGKTIEEFIKE